MAALRRGETPETLAEWSGIDSFFLNKLRKIVDCERQLLQASELTPAIVRGAKRLGFSDRQIGTLMDEMPDIVQQGGDDQRGRGIRRLGQARALQGVGELRNPVAVVIGARAATQ